MFLDYNIPSVWKDGQYVVVDPNFPNIPLNDVFKVDLASIEYPSVLYMNKHR